MADKPDLHGRDHRPGGADPMTSGNTAEGEVLTADGLGGIRWDTVSSSGGLQFDTDPQTGNWLLVTTTSTHTSGSSNGIQLKSTGGDILFDADDNTARMRGASAFITASGSGGTLGLQSSVGPAYLAGFTQAALTGGDTDDPPNYSFFEAHTTHAIIKAQELDFAHPTEVGHVLQIIEVGGDWEYHIKTGASWVADL